MSEALEKLVRKRNAAGIVSFFAGMDEAERRALAPGVVALAKVGGDSMLGEAKAPFAFDHDAHACANLAVAATATIAEMKKLGWRFSPPFWEPDKQDLWLAVLRDRSPEWIDDWAEWLLEDNHRAWRFVRRMERAGLCRPLDSESYVLGMIEGVWPQREGATLLDGIMTDRELLNGPFWRLFEVEGGGEVSLANFEKYGGGDGWAHAMLELAARGELDRGRLLDASLEALARDFSHYRAGWFSRFHEYMEPTADERASRVEHYLGLLASPIPPTVAFAMKALAALHKAKRLDGAAFVARVEPVLYAKAKSTVKHAMRLLGAFAKAEGALAPDVCRTAAVALEHPESEVQEAALALLETFAGDADAGLRDAIIGRRDLIAAPLRSRFDALVGGDTTRENASAPAEDADALVRLAGAPPPDLAAAAGVDFALRAWRTGDAVIETADYDGLNVPRISEESEADRIEDLDALIAAYPQALADPFDVELVERVVEAVCRLCGDRPADFAARTEALRKGVARLPGKFGFYDSPSWTSPLGTLVLLGHAWLEGKDPTPLCHRIIGHHLHVTQAGAAGIFLDRALELAGFVAAENPTTALSTPTHQGGWIAPAVLAQRLHSREETGYGPTEADLVLALLRLAPEGREAALVMSDGLTGEPGAALRHALGGEKEKIAKSTPIWIAAARTRAPFEDDPAVDAKFPGLGPDAGQAAKLEFEIQTRTWKDSYTGKEESWDYLASRFAPAPPGLPENEVFWKALTSAVSRRYGKFKLLPTVLAHTTPIESTGGASPDRLSHEKMNSPWSPILWPANPLPLYNATALNASGWEHSQRPAAEPPLSGYRVALSPDAPLGGPGRLMLAMGLNALDAAEGQMATDLLIAVIADGRLDPEALGRDMARLVNSTLIKPKRWAAKLKIAARESALHAQAVRLALERALSLGNAKPPRDVHAPMELLHELCVESGEAITIPDTRAFLATIKGSGKAAKLAKTLLALKESDPLPHRRTAAAIALAGRVKRAERWAARRTQSK
jgi:hypothetical protein